MAVTPTVRINVSGARGPRGAASGPLGLNSVGGDEINGAEAAQIRDKIEPAKGGFSQDTAADDATIDAKLKQVVSPLDAPFGADTAGGDSSEAVAAAADFVPFGGRLWVPPGKRIITTGYDGGKRGVVVEGGKLIKNEAGWNYQLNSYARRMGHVIGRGNDARVRAGIAASQQIKGFFYGDSRWADSDHGGGYAGDNATPDKLWAAFMANNGVRNDMLFTNRSVGGRSYADIFAANPIADLSATTHFVAFTGSVNRESDDPLVEAQTIWDGFDAVRNATYGDLSELTIYVATAISTHDLPGHRTSSWYEDFRGFWEEVTYYFKLCTTDLFALFPDSTAWAGLNGDTPFVHPNGDLTTQAHAECVNAWFPKGSLYLVTGNRYVGVAFQPGWANFSPSGSGNYQVAVSLSEDGEVSARGRAIPNGGTLTNNGKMWQCPNPNYHPKRGTGPLTAWVYNGSSWVPFPFRVDVDGYAYAEAAATGITAMSFDGCRWSARTS